LLQTPIDPLDFVALLLDVFDAFEQILATIKRAYSLPSFFCTMTSSAKTEIFERRETLLARDVFAALRPVYFGEGLAKLPKS
jgi:hypothetical protein